MADHASAKKRIRRNANRAEINGARRTRIRTFIKAVETAIDNSNAQGAQDALQKAQPEMQRGVSKGVFKKKAISRKLSRLSGKIKALKAK